MADSPINADYQRIFEVIGQIPRGRVATYGQVAALAGFKRRARLVGRALRTVAAAEDLPWQRVVNSQGRISQRAESHGSEDLQRVMLEAEGVQFSSSGKIDLERYRWEPGPEIMIGGGSS